jgi:hypothetical protein
VNNFSTVGIVQLLYVQTIYHTTCRKQRKGKTSMFYGTLFKFHVENHYFIEHLKYGVDEDLYFYCSNVYYFNMDLKNITYVRNHTLRVCRKSIPHATR